MQKEQRNPLYRYQLRHAAGIYWLLDMEQDINNYKCPMSMNAMGAEIFEKLRDGQTIEEIAKELSIEYQTDITQIETDVLEFDKQLIQYGVITGE